MVKWDAATDQILLLKILETSKVNADVKAIAEAWPADMDKPTPRAISERLVKIRKDVKTTGVSSGFSVQNKGLAPGTPQKRAARGPNKKPSAAKNVNGNGKRSMLDDSSDDSSSPESPSSSARPIKRAKSTIIKNERPSLVRDPPAPAVKVEGGEDNSSTGNGDIVA